MIDVAPALSWSHRQAGSLDGIAVGASTIAASIRSLESELGLHLEAQTELLEKQLALLGQIHQTLLTPAKTRAAERLADVAELLRRNRWERALALSEEAMADDPNNPAAFSSAGWASLGLKRLNDAQKHFLESAQASDGDTRSCATRQAARLAFAISGPDEALRVLAFAIDDQTGEKERYAVAYDTAIYSASANELEKAEASLLDAIQGDDRYCLMALNDELLAGHAPLITCAADALSALIGNMKKERQNTEQTLRRCFDLLREAEAAAHDLGRNQERLELVESLSKQERRLDEIRASDYPSFRRVLEALEDAHTNAEEIAARVQQWEQVLRTDEAARNERERLARELTRKRTALLDEAIAKLQAEKGANVVHRSETVATLSCRRWGGLRKHTWAVRVNDDLRVIVVEQKL
jgi:hypothetical protein